MSGELFRGSAAEEWQGDFYSRLAVVCAAAGLTVLEARAVNACCRNLSLVHSGRLLGLTGNPKQVRGAMWHNLNRASGKLETFVYSRPRPAAVRNYRQSRLHTPSYVLSEIIEVMRTFDPKPRPVLYDQRGTPVTMRGRLVHASDLSEEHRPQPDWLDDLCVTIQAKLALEKSEGALVGC